MADPIKIEVVYEVNDGEELGLYAEGHHEPAAFAAAVAEWRKGDGRWLDEGYIPEVPVDEVRHETWRNEEGGEGYVFRPALPGEPGAYPVTCFAFEGGMLAASPPPASSPPETPAPEGNRAASVADAEGLVDAFERAIYGPDGAWVGSKAAEEIDTAKADLIAAIRSLACPATATGNPVDCGGCPEHASPASATSRGTDHDPATKEQS